MKHRVLIPLATIMVLAACGGSAPEAPLVTSQSSAKRAQAATVVAVSGNTIAFPGNRADYVIAATSTGFSVNDVVGTGTAVAVTSSQLLQFADTTVALDLDGNAGKLYRVYKAAFGRTPDASGIGFWLDVTGNKGVSIEVAVDAFLASDESKAKFGVSPTNAELVTAVYTNVLGREFDQGGYNFWLGHLNTNTITRAQFLTAFADGAENKGIVNPTIATGFSFTAVTRIAANTVPGVPTIGAATAGNASATVAFTAPANSGGVPITGYTARCAANGATATASGPASPLSLTALTNGVLYTCTVLASNSLGNSAVSGAVTVTPVAPAVVVTVPGAPAILSATAGNASASIAFSAPASNGGAAISSYTASCTGSGATKTASGSASPLAVTGLTNGVVYTCSVTAANSAGSGFPSGVVTVLPVAPVVVTAPGAPTIVSATAGNTTAAIAFTAPASNGGAAISGYTASCTAGSTTKTASGSASPLSVTGLTNLTVYSCSVKATNSAGTSVASSALSVTPTSGATSATTTGHTYCAYSNSVLNATLKLTSTVAIACSDTTARRTMTGNGVPDHFANPTNPGAIGAVTVNFVSSLNPVATSTASPIEHVTGYANNGVKFDPSTAESYQNAGVWKIEALNQSYFPFGTDGSNAHTQSTGAYHYHGMPEKYIETLNKGTGMALIGFAMDGFPIYARYGYKTATDATSGTKVITSSYRLKTTASSGRPATSIVPMGTFTQDYEYVAGLGDLDECNGRTGVTPEFPKGIYHYFVTDSYPYIQRCVKGTIIPPGPK
ncbi:MAG: YHYH protein [Pseudomonadota bacterium]